jgi:hypothetical protein
MTTAAVSEQLNLILQSVDEATDEAWRELALQAVFDTCRKMPEFISDDVWEVGGLKSTREDRAMGPVLMRAKKNGWCVKTNRVRPSVRSHLSGKPVWESRLYDRS